LKEFPGKTEGDLYLWVVDHQQYLAEEEGRMLQQPTDAARNFLENKNKKSPRKKKAAKSKDSSKKSEKK
jgi:hypothetical protein